MSNEVNIFNEKKYNLSNFPNLSNSILTLTLTKTNNNFISSEIAVIFIDEKESLNLNTKYRKKDYVADVLSFPNNKEDLIINKQHLKDLGDIYICYSKAQNQSQTYEHSLTRELSFLFLHGLLHNLGYDHEDVKDEKIMFGLQKEILNELKILRN